MKTATLTPIEAIRGLKKRFVTVVPLYTKQMFMVTDPSGKKSLVDEDGTEISESHQAQVRDQWMIHNGGVVVSNALVLHFCTETGYTALFSGKKSKWE